MTTLPEMIWVLRAPCGCPCGSSDLAVSEAEAWKALAGDEGYYASRGYTVEREPAATAVPDVRRRLGRCRHKDSGETRWAAADQPMSMRGEGGCAR